MIDPPPLRVRRFGKAEVSEHNLRLDYWTTRPQ